MMADFVRGAPQARVLRHGEDKTASGAHPCGERVECALVVWDVLQYIKTPNNIECRGKIGVHDIALIEFSTGQMPCSVGESLGIGVDPGKL